MTRCAQVLMLVCSVLVSACGGGASAPAEQTGGKPAQTKAPKDQIALSAEEQATGKIETQPAEATDAPAMLRASGRIARAEDRRKMYDEIKNIYSKGLQMERKNSQQKRSRYM